MASDQAAVTLATSAAIFPSTLAEPATLPTTSISPPESDPARTKSLKRSRADQSPNPNITPLSHAALGQSPSPKSPRFKGAFSPSFAPLTGAAAFEDDRRRKEELAREAEASHSGAMSENPASRALSSLMAGGGAAMSRPQDAPVATAAMSEGMTKVANAITIPAPTTNEKSEVSPASVTSLASLGSTAQTATAGASPNMVASPGAMTGLSDSEGREGRTATSTQFKVPEEQPANRALSFPGHVLAQPDASRGPLRGMSLPMPGQNQQLAPRSPSHKKHKCPYCETEFTRHHNLKSHLLTHSQEKPYVCQTCAMRFRRLHDLKRHMKLHTGERPHICPKCDRKFARGDALARHSKGQGGCAGRRASMGSFGGEDDYEVSNAGDDDGGMEGVMYTNGMPQGNEADMTEEERRRLSLPSIKAQHVAGHQGSGDSYISHSRTPSTYPPAGPRQFQSSGGLYPPNADRNSSGSGTSPTLQSHGAGVHSPSGSLSSMAAGGGGGPIFSQGGMTESPKPLSPAGMQSHQLGHDSSISRQRSPSLTTQFQQQHFGRRQSGRASPTGMSLPSPHATSQGPKLPALSGLAPPDQRYTLTSQTTGQHGMPNGGSQVQSGASSPGTAFQPPRSGPLHQQGSGSGESANVFASGDRGIWAYCQTLEDREKKMEVEINNLRNEKQQAVDQIKTQQEQINRLSEEVAFLRGQAQIPPTLSQQPPASASS